MKPNRNSRIAFILLALFVTFLWSSSWVLIKWGLTDFPPVVFAGIRYFMAFLCLLPFAMQKKVREQIGKLTRKNWIQLLILGLLYYTLTQGAQFVGLAHMPAMAVSLIISFTSIFVAGIGSVILGEKPTLIQWVGLILNVLGAYLYFFPVKFSDGQLWAIGVVFIGMLANSVSMVLGRKINRDEFLSPIGVTSISMGFGSLLLLISGLVLEDIPDIQIKNWLIVVWLALVNTALAFTLWNTALKKLRAMEASIINNTMTVQIAALAWFVLGEGMDTMEMIGAALSVIGAILVQVGGSKRSSMEKK